ncbi:lipopolysaccharide biosynthesis protein [Xylanibacter ruminicola]|nr:oligosaccharide flippase family protein [Xylanibacter ruminicola]
MTPTKKHLNQENMTDIKVLKEKLRGSNLMKGFAATFLGSGASKVLLVLTTFLCSNLLSKGEFGEFSFVRNTLNVILCICALNFSSLCTKFTTEAKFSIESLHRLFLLFLFSFFICAIIGFFLVVAPESFLLNIFSTAFVVKFFRISGLLLPFFMLEPLFEGIMRGLKKFKLIGLLQTASSVFYLLVVFIGIKQGGLTGAMYGVILYYLLYALISFFVINRLCSVRKICYRLNGFYKQGGALLTMILPIFFMSFIEAPTLWIAQVILSKSESMGAIGSMTAMMQVRNLAMLIPGYFTNTYLAFAGELNAQQKYSEYYSQFSRIERSYFIIGIILFLFLSLLSQPILFLYGKEYVLDWPVMIISNIGIPIVMLASLYRVDLILKDHQAYLFVVSLVWNVAWIVIMFVMIKLSMAPLYSFFISQNIAAFIFVVLLYRGYNKDKVIKLI